MNPKVTINDYKKSFLSKRTKQKQELKQGVNSTFLIMISLIISLFLYYVWSLNAHATAWYDIRWLESEKNQLIWEQEIIITQISQLESLDTIIHNADNIKNMKKIVSPEFLIIEDSAKYVFNN